MQMCGLPVTNGMIPYERIPRTDGFSDTHMVFCNIFVILADENRTWRTKMDYCYLYTDNRNLLFDLRALFL